MVSGEILCKVEASSLLMEGMPLIPVKSSTPVKQDALSSLTHDTINSRPRVSTLSKEMHNQGGGEAKEIHPYTRLIQSLFLSYSIRNNQAQRGDADEFA